MTLNLDWSQDPIVQLEDQILPALWLPYEFLIAYDAALELPGLSEKLNRSAHLLRTCGKEFFEKEPVEFSAEDKAVILDAAEKVDRMSKRLTQMAAIDEIDRTLRHDFAEFIRTKVRPAITQAINLFRGRFISMVLTRQYKHASMSEGSLTELDVISKKIFFVAINASIEAARIGDQGAGFAHIGTEIRSLSLDAQTAIDKIRS